MKFKATAPLALMLTMALLGQTLFARAHATTVAHTAAVPRTVTVMDADDLSARIARFETVLESLRQELKIPAYSAAIVKDQKVIWARGFGYADIENKIPATEHTPYHLASLTKTFASTILMQLVQEGKVKLVDPLGMNETAPNVPRIVSSRSPNAARQAAEAEVKAAVMDVLAGYNSGNVDQIEKRLAPQHNRFLGEGGFLTSFNGSDLRQAIQAGFKFKFEVYNLEAAVYGDSAITTFFMKGDVIPANGATRTEGPWRWEEH